MGKRAQDKPGLTGPALAFSAPRSMPFCFLLSAFSFLPSALFPHQALSSSIKHYQAKNSPALADAYRTFFSIPSSLARSSALI
jgi:hypothetical protein